MSNNLDRIILASQTINDNLSLIDSVSNDDTDFLLQKFSIINNKIERLHSDQLEEARRKREGSILNNVGKNTRKECSICMESKPGLTMLKHNVGQGYHHIHAKCLAEWRHGSGSGRSNSKNCPVCRKKISETLSDGSEIKEYIHENPRRILSSSSSSSDSDDDILIIGQARNRARLKKSKRKKKKSKKKKK
jgi:hypothetical protein